MLQQTVKPGRLADSTELHAERFDLDEKLLQVDDLLVSDEALKEDANESHLEVEKKLNLI